MPAELLILGGGPGGYTAAFRAADLGKKVTLVEESPTLGGVCLNVGCIPSKTLLHLAEQIIQARELAAWGVGFPDPDLDLDKIRKHRDKVVGRLTRGLGALAKKRSVEVVTGRGVFDSPSRVIVRSGSEKRSVEFEQCVIAVGSKPIRLPGAPADERIWDSTDALKLETVPEDFLILGGGIIGMEMAAVYRALGSRVTVVEMAGQLIPAADRDMAAILQKKSADLGISILLGTRLESIAAEGKKIRAVFGGGENAFDAALVAIGRSPNTDRINLEATGIDTDEQGRIPVDETQKTSVSHIFAIGDVTAGPMLAHKASHEGRVAAEVAAGLKSAFIARAIPSVAYTIPEIAWCGLTEKEAKEKGIDFIKGEFPWAASGRALTQGCENGKTRLLFDKETGRVIGAAIAGCHAGELIAEATLALEMGADMEDLSRTIHAHPTLAETLAHAAEAANKTILEL